MRRNGPVTDPARRTAGITIAPRLGKVADLATATVPTPRGGFSLVTAYAAAARYAATSTEHGIPEHKITRAAFQALTLALDAQGPGRPGHVLRVAELRDRHAGRGLI